METRSILTMLLMFLPSKLKDVLFSLKFSFPSSMVYNVRLVSWKLLSPVLFRFLLFVNRYYYLSLC